MSELIEDLYPAFLATGNSPLLFWELSIAEISAVLLAFEERRKIDMKEQLSINTTLAQQIYERIGDLIARDEHLEFTPVWDWYPELFEEEKKLSEERKKQQELRRYKEQFISYSLRHNNGRSEES